MKGEKRRLKAPSLARQRQHVLRLGEEVLSAAHAHEADECEVWLKSSRGPWECEDDGRRLAFLEADGNRMIHAFACLAPVEDAPEKIPEGIYELSDVSGHQIPQDRLEMEPDAICTLNEEPAFECTGKPGRLQ